MQNWFRTLSLLNLPLCPLPLPTTCHHLHIFVFLGILLLGRLLISSKYKPKRIYTHREKDQCLDEVSTLCSYWREEARFREGKGWFGFKTSHQFCFTNQHTLNHRPPFPGSLVEAFISIWADCSAQIPRNPFHLPPTAQLHLARQIPWGVVCVCITFTTVKSSEEFNF